MMMMITIFGIRLTCTSWGIPVAFLYVYIHVCERVKVCCHVLVACESGTVSHTQIYKKMYAYKYIYVWQTKWVLPTHAKKMHT